MNVIQSLHVMKVLDCINTFGSFVCEDVNECFHGSDICPENTFCLNLPGSYKCIDPCGGLDCSDGYVQVRHDTNCECVDVNECLTDSCPAGTICENHEGGHKCIDLDRLTNSVRGGLFQTPCIIE